MSVETTADEKVDLVRKHIQGSIEDLSEVVINRCWGHNEFSKEFRAKLKIAFDKLLELRDILE